MALISSDTYGELNRGSASQNPRTPGKFFSVFITGDVRPGQEFGKLQCMNQIDGGDYLVQNAGVIYFLPYFIKRHWAKYIDTKGRDNQTYSKMVAFGWEDDVPKIDDQCKYEYVIAGLLLDQETKKAKHHDKDFEDAGVKKGDPVLIHFRCGGIRFNGAMKLVDEFSKKTKELEALSDSPEFEMRVVTPRRFICKSEVTIQSSDYGNKNVFKFNPEIKLPDNAVEKVMQSAKDLLPEFEKQFNKTDRLKASSGSSNPVDGAPIFEEAPQPVPESQTPEKDENFDLGI